MPEYLKHRCCMCPNKENPSNICPGVKGILHPDPSPCRFVKRYKDSRSWKYRILSGLGESSYKARYQDDKHDSEDSNWHGCRQLPWRKSFDEAQADLNKLAEKNGWTEY